MNRGAGRGRPARGGELGVGLSICGPAEKGKQRRARQKGVEVEERAKGRCAGRLGEKLYTSKYCSSTYM